MSNIGNQVCAPDGRWMELSCPLYTARALLDAYKSFAGKPFLTQHFSCMSKFVQSFVRSNNTSVVFIGELVHYSSSGALGRNYTRCQNSACLEIPATDLLARSQCICELLEVFDWVINTPGLDIDEVLTTINEICCNSFSLYIHGDVFQDFSYIIASID